MVSADGVEREAGGEEKGRAVQGRDRAQSAKGFSASRGNARARTWGAALPSGTGVGAPCACFFKICMRAYTRELGAKQLREQLRVG